MNNDLISREKSKKKLSQIDGTRAIAEVCKRHLKLIDGYILDCGDCPLRYPKYYDEVFDCRLHNYPFDYRGYAKEK